MFASCSDLQQATSPACHTMIQVIYLVTPVHYISLSICFAFVSTMFSGVVLRKAAWDVT